MENEVPGDALPGGNNFQLSGSLSELPSITGLEGFGGTGSSQASFAGNAFLRPKAEGASQQGEGVVGGQGSIGSSADFNDFLRGSTKEGQAASMPSQASPLMPAPGSDEDTQAVAEALAEAALGGASQAQAPPATGSGSQVTIPSEVPAVPKLPEASPVPSGSQAFPSFPSGQPAIPKLGGSGPPPQHAAVHQPIVPPASSSDDAQPAVPSGSGAIGEQASSQNTHQPPATVDSVNGNFGDDQATSCGSMPAGRTGTAAIPSSSSVAAEHVAPAVGAGNNPVPSPPWQSSPLLPARQTSEAGDCNNRAGPPQGRYSEPPLPAPAEAPPSASACKDGSKSSRGGWIVQGRIQPAEPPGVAASSPAAVQDPPLQSGSRMRSGQLPTGDAQPPWLDLLKEMREMWSAGILPGQPAGAAQSFPSVQQMPPQIPEQLLQQLHLQQQQQLLQQMRQQPLMGNWPQFQMPSMHATPMSAPAGLAPEAPVSQAQEPPKADASSKESKEVQADGRIGAKELQMQQDLSSRLQQFRSQHLPELRQRRDELVGAVQAIDGRSAELRQRCAEAEREGREDFEVLRSHLNSVESLKQAVLGRERDVRQRLINGIDDFVRWAQQAADGQGPEAVASFTAEYPDLQTAVDALCSRACSLPQVDVPVDDIPFEARTRADKLRRYVVADRLLKAKDFCLWRLEQQRRQLSSEVSEGAEWIRHLGSLLDRYAEELGQVCYFCAERFCAAAANTRCAHNLGASPRSGRPLSPDPRVPQQLWGAGVHFWVPLPAPASAAAAAASAAAPGVVTAPGSPSLADVYREMWPHGQHVGLSSEPALDLAFAALREPVLSRNPTPPPQAYWRPEPPMMPPQPSQATAPSSSSRAPSPSAAQAGQAQLAYAAHAMAMSPPWAFGSGGPAPARAEPSAGPVSAASAGLQTGIACLRGSGGGGGPLPPAPHAESGLAASLPQSPLLQYFQPCQPTEGQATFLGDPAAQELWQRVGRAMRERGVLLRQAFALFDSDGDGAVSKQELAEAFRLMRLGLNDLEIERLLRDIDTNQDGLVNLQEFGSRLQFLDLASLGS
eukprot:CAMPEP_0197630846 /NCGR_PEP_ID=MMETSP1338-20131121/8201_1 /TAXON_ID=43686 ORGANISM="Pelagodinium beii, Strain RCC1491" /NCGR_SAMPLE_ID=MMETSP1338 /ASSEMBLY_ACC=CAM_ASM_000754 /LENGTH=1065 /DNA_ID=CAMNT_0043202159 /DNA_START=26 /DNA_END=3223 /DNA_ORIENTATION=+